MGTLLTLWGLARKVPAWLWLLGVLVGGAVWGYRKYEAAVQDKVVAELALEGQKAITKEVQARLASEKVAKDSVTALLEAARVMHGELVAAVGIRLQRRDTTIVVHEIPTTTHPDSTRTAEFKDSTFAGVIQGTVTAPPCCAPLEVGYMVTRPEFKVTVGFVKVGRRYAALVNWPGDSVRVEAPFYDPPPPRQGLMGAYAGALYGLRGDVRGRVGVLIRGFSGFRVSGGVTARWDAKSGVNDPEAEIGLWKEW